MADGLGCVLQWVFCGRLELAVTGHDGHMALCSVLPPTLYTQSIESSTSCKIPALQELADHS